MSLGQKKKLNRAGSQKMPDYPSFPIDCPCFDSLQCPWNATDNGGHSIMQSAIVRAKPILPNRLIRIFLDHI